MTPIIDGYFSAFFSWAFLIRKKNTEINSFKKWVWIKCYFLDQVKFKVKLKLNFWIRFKFKFGSS